MIEPVSLLAGAGVMLAGYLIGRRNPRTKLPDSTMCAGCKHSITFRNPDTGNCTAQVEQATKWDGLGSPVAYRYVPCTCASHATADQLLIAGPTWEASRPPLNRNEPPKEIL